MTKRPLYAAASTAASLAAVLTVLPASARAASDPQSGACAQCLSIAIDPGASTLLPAELLGMEVFVRVTAGKEDIAVPALIEIERRGGQPGLLIASIPTSLSPDVIGHMRRLVVTEPIRPVGQSDEGFAFALKTSLTAVRAAIAPTIYLGMAADAEEWRSLLSRELASYVDFLVLSDSSPFESAGVEVWRHSSRIHTVSEALAATATPGASHLIWSLPSEPATAAALATELLRVMTAPAPAPPDVQQPQTPDRFAQDVHVVGSR